MSSPRMFGLEKRDGHEIGRDPQGMSREDLHRAAALISPDKTQGKIGNSMHEGAQVPDTPPANSSLKILGDQSGDSA